MEIVELAVPPERPFDVHFWVRFVQSTPEVIDIISHSKIGFIKNNIIIPVDTFFQINKGVYEIQHFGVFRALKEINPEKLVLDWLKSHPFGGNAKFDDYDFIRDVFSKGYFEQVQMKI
jgi:hypothetical protein